MSHRVEIAASETGMSTKTGVRDGSVLKDQRWLHWGNKLLPALRGEDLEVRLPSRSNIVHDGNRLCGDLAA